MARGWFQPFYSRLAEHISPEGRLDREFHISQSLRIGLQFFGRGLRILKPRIYRLAQPRAKPVVIYSDAEWTVLETAAWQRKNLGGLMRDGDTVSAAALDTPMHDISVLSERKTQIIPLPLECFIPRGRSCGAETCCCSSTICQCAAP